MRFAKVLAALDARDYVLPDDVKAAVPPVLRHRLIVKPEADLEGVTTDQILHEVIRAVDVPK
jgi:MoxR-like ATPase